MKVAKKAKAAADAVVVAVDAIVVNVASAEKTAMHRRLKAPSTVPP